MVVACFALLFLVAARTALFLLVARIFLGGSVRCGQLKDQLASGSFIIYGRFCSSRTQATLESS